MKITFQSSSGSAEFATFAELAVAMNTSPTTQSSTHKGKRNSENNISNSSNSTKSSLCDVFSQVAAETATEATLEAKKTTKKSSKKARKARKAQKAKENSKVSQDIAQMIFGNTVPSQVSWGTNINAPKMTSSNSATNTQGFLSDLASTLGPQKPKVTFGAKTFAEVAATVIESQKDKTRTSKSVHKDIKPANPCSNEVQAPEKLTSKPIVTNEVKYFLPAKNTPEAWTKASAAVKVPEKTTKPDWETQGKSKKTKLSAKTKAKDQKKLSDKNTPKAWTKASAPERPSAERVAKGTKTTKDTGKSTMSLDSAKASTKTIEQSEKVVVTKSPPTEAQPVSVGTKAAKSTKTYAQAVKGVSIKFATPILGKANSPNLPRSTSSAPSGATKPILPQITESVQSEVTTSKPVSTPEGAFSVSTMAEPTKSEADNDSEGWQKVKGRRSRKTVPLRAEATPKYSNKTLNSEVGNETNSSVTKPQAKSSVRVSSNAKVSVKATASSHMSNKSTNETQKSDSKLKTTTQTSRAKPEKNFLPISTPPKVPKYVPEIDKDGFQMVRSRRYKPEVKEAVKTFVGIPHPSSPRSSVKDTPQAWRKASFSPRSSSPSMTKKESQTADVKVVEKNPKNARTSSVTVATHITPSFYESSSATVLRSLKTANKPQNGPKSRKTLAATGYLISAK